MWAKRYLAGLIVATVFSCSVVLAGTPESHFVEGNTLLAKGDLSSALKAYAAAVQADRSNQQYAQQFMLVRRAIQLQNAFDKETDSARSVQIGEALRSFYVSYGLYDQALPIDQAVFGQLKTADSAIQLAETLLALNEEGGAAEVLGNLGQNTATKASQALLSVALAREGQLQEARRIAGDISLDADTGPGTLYIFARMQSALGERDLALSTLRRCFESVPPSRLDALKSHANKCADFASVVSSTGFSEVLQVESKVSESQCSAGSSCGNCPMRRRCQSNSGQ